MDEQMAEVAYTVAMEIHGDSYEEWHVLDDHTKNLWVSEWNAAWNRIIEGR